ncbi:5-carboxymethyl-2-hydroxymuconate Delta-isomerase [Niveispirillum sp. KHB5.9]|uniref:5-carboxymethyl-2-hydroxymuconate Delta-isomerase n=1 Tax=Niveispirillum sp. KHB5.9 TaxID=3400269 RepID=UPI003A878116
MPHCIVEYTDNLADEGDIPGLLRKLAAKLCDSGGVFPPGGVRVRAIRLSEYVVADGAEDDAFVNLTVKIGPGRPDEFKKAFFGAVFAIVEDHFTDLFARRYLALTLYVEEADEAGSFKKNNIHARFRKENQ